MRVSRARLYAALAVAMAVAYGVGVGPYWVADAVVFTTVVGVVAWFSFRRGPKTTGTEPDEREQVPRSRITHYVIVSWMKSTAVIAKESNIPFERALLNEPGWRTLSGESLEEISRKAPDPSAERACGRKPT